MVIAMGHFDTGQNSLGIVTIQRPNSENESELDPTYWVSSDLQRITEVAIQDDGTPVPNITSTEPLSQPWLNIISDVQNDAINTTKLDWRIWWSQSTKKPTLVQTQVCDNLRTFIIEIDFEHIMNEFNRLK